MHSFIQFIVIVRLSFTIFGVVEFNPTRNLSIRSKWTGWILSSWMEMLTQNHWNVRPTELESRNAHAFVFRRPVPSYIFMYAFESKKTKIHKNRRRWFEALLVNRRILNHWQRNKNLNIYRVTLNYISYNIICAFDWLTLEMFEA